MVTKPLGAEDVSNLDYDKLCTLAKEHTGPPPSRSYKDDSVVRELFRIAKSNRSGHAWTRALRARREAHQKWREEQVKAATSGDWGAFRACKGKKHPGWEVHLADALQPQDPHQAAHDHYSSIFQGPGCADLPPLPEPPPSPDFNTEEIEMALSKGHNGKSVGKDGISLELLKAIAEVPGGKESLASWLSHLLHTGDLPEGWHRSVMVLLPKVAKPLHVRDTRPISTSSSIERLFSRLILRRCRDLHSPKKPWQACGPRRQSLDFLHSIYRLYETERKWQRGLALLGSFSCI